MTTTTDDDLMIPNSMLSIIGIIGVSLVFLLVYLYMPNPFPTDKVLFLNVASLKKLNSNETLVNVIIIFFVIYSLTPDF